MCRCFHRFLCSTWAQSKVREAISYSNTCQWRLNLKFVKQERNPKFVKQLATRIPAKWRLLVWRRITRALETIVPYTVYWQLLMLLRPSFHTQCIGNHWCSLKPSSHTQCIACYYCMSASSNHCPTKCEAISSYRVAKTHKIPYLYTAKQPFD